MLTKKYLPFCADTALLYADKYIAVRHRAMHFVTLRSLQAYKAAKLQAQDYFATLRLKASIACLLVRVAYTARSG